MEDDLSVSDAEAVAAVIAGTGTSMLASVAKSISYRIPVVYLERIDAAAAEAGKSRNAMLNMVVGAGLDAVWSHLPKKTLKALEQRQAQIHQLIADTAHERVREG